MYDETHLCHGCAVALGEIPAWHGTSGPWASAPESVEIRDISLANLLEEIEAALRDDGMWPS